MKVTLYTRVGCCLCDQAKQVIESARAKADFELEELDIDRDPELVNLYNDEVPVIAINGRPAFRYRVELAELMRELA